MAYSNYGYPGYQPYYSQPVPDQLAQLRQQQMMQQPVMQPAQMPVANQPMQPQISQPNQQNSGILWVGSKMEADAYLVAPNSAVALWDANNPVVYLRQADSTGKPTTKVYDLVERTDNPQPQSAPQIDLSRYMTREAAEEMIQQRVEEILSERLKKPVKATLKKEED